MGPSLGIIHVLATLVAIAATVGAGTSPHAPDAAADPTEVVAVTVTNDTLQGNFLGIGFDLLPQWSEMPEVWFNEVYGKRLAEFRPGFVRTDPSGGNGTPAAIHLGRTLPVLERGGSTILFTTFSPPYILSLIHI